MIPSISVSHHPPEYSTNITFIHKNKKNSLFPSVPNAVSYLNTFSDIYFCAILHSCSKLYCVVVFSTNHCLFECVAPSTAKNSSVIHSFSSLVTALSWSELQWRSSQRKAEIYPGWNAGLPVGTKSHT